MRALIGFTVICLLAVLLVRQSEKSPPENANAPQPRSLKSIVEKKTEHSKPNAQPTAVSKPAQAFSGDVVINLETVEMETRRVRLRGNTNLPPGTELSLSVEEASPGGFNGGSQTTVRLDGTFESESFGPANGLKDGRYFAEVVMPYPFVQPAGVQQIIGTKGERLTGPLVKREELGATASKKKEFLIGGVGAVAAQDARVKDRVRQYREWVTYVSDLHRRIQQAHSLDLLANDRNLANLAKWGEFARAYRAETQAKSDQLMKLDSPYPRLLIGTVMGDIDNMFSAIAFKKGEQQYQSAEREYGKDLAELQKFVKEQAAAP